MPIIVATITPNEGCADRVEAEIKAVATDVQRRPGCEVYALHRGKRQVVIIEKWPNREALRAWGASPELRELHDRLLPLVESLEDNFVVLRAVPTGDPAKGAI